MIPPLLGRKLRTRLPRDPVPEDGLAALELARLVVWMHPVGDFQVVVAGLYIGSQLAITRKNK